jgi:hypothetical protein
VVVIYTRDISLINKLSTQEKAPLILHFVDNKHIIIFKNNIIPDNTKKYLSYDTVVKVERMLVDISECNTTYYPRYDDIPYVSEEMIRAISVASDNPIHVKPVISTEYKTEPIHWLWKNHIPVGELTVIAGKPGQGKTWVALDIAARLSTGNRFPDGSDAPICKTVYYTGGSEDSRDSIYMRLRGLKANMKNICVVDTMQGLVTTKEGQQVEIQEPPTITTIIDTLARTIIEAVLVGGETNVKLVVLDSVTSLIETSVDIYKSNEVAAVMNRLRTIAKKLQVAVIMIMHHKKGKEDHADFKVAGSYGFVSCARVVWHVDTWKDDKKERIFVQGKNNLCPQQPSYRFRIEPIFTGDLVDSTITQVNWLGKEDYDANSYEEEKEHKITMREKAKKWLQKQLEGNSQGLERQEILNRAEGIFNRKLLEKIIKDIGIIEKNGKIAIWKLNDVGNTNNNGTDNGQTDNKTMGAVTQ